jgi:hypothetical protein
MEGTRNNPRYFELAFLFSLGNRTAKKRKAVGRIPDAANPILPQNNIEASLLRE